MVLCVSKTWSANKIDIYMPLANHSAVIADSTFFTVVKHHLLKITWSEWQDEMAASLHLWKNYMVDFFWWNKFQMQNMTELSIP